MQHRQKMKLFCAWQMSILGCFYALWKGGSTYRSVVVGWVVSISVVCSPSQARAELPSSPLFHKYVWPVAGTQHALKALHPHMVSESFSPCVCLRLPKTSFCQNQFSPHPSSAPMKMLCTKPGINQLCSLVLSSAAIQASRQAQLQLIPPLFKTNTTTACRATAEPYPNLVCVWDKHYTGSWLDY